MTIIATLSPILPGRAQSLATITGTVVYNGMSASKSTDKWAVFWARDENTGQSFPINPSYNPSTGTYSIPNIPSGKYGISVFIDDAMPFNGQHGFAGDFDGWTSPIIVSEGQSLVYKDLPVQRTIHTTSPVDNIATIGHTEDPKDTYQADEIVFRWDALAEAASYRAWIEEWQEPSYTFVRVVQEFSTSNTEWKPVLLESGGNGFYQFHLYAYNRDGTLVGKLMVPYENGHGWDYRFRIIGVPTCQVTFQQTGVDSDYSGTILIVDNTSYAPSQLPKTFAWNYGALHSFAWSSPLSASTGKRYAWNSTSGLSTRQSATINATGTGSITGNYQTQYLLSIQVSPSGAGTTSPSPGSYWYDAGTQVQVSASPATGYAFKDWTSVGAGGYSDPSNPTTVTMNGPITETANFETAPFFYWLIFLVPFSIVTLVGVTSDVRRRHRIQLERQRLERMKQEILDRIDEVTRKKG